MGIFRRSVLENPNVPLTADQLIGVLGVGLRTAAGVSVSEDSAMRLVPVLACIRLIAEIIASLPIDVIVRDGNKRRTVDPPPWLVEPNPDLSQLELIEELLSSLLSNGNSVSQVVRGARQMPVEVYPVDRRTCSAARDSNGKLFYTFQGSSKPNYTGPDGSVLHIKGFRRPGQIWGLSPIQVHRQAIGLGLAAEQFGAEFFGQGAHLSGVIENPNEMTVAQAQVLLATWKSKHGGLSNAHQPGVLTNGSKWTPISIPPEDAQFLQTRNYQLGDIARIYRVPPHLVGDMEKSTSWGTGIEEQNLQFAVFTLRTWIVRLERSLTTLLPPGQQLRFNLDALLRGKTKDRYEAYAIGRQWGWESVNTINEKEDKDPIGPEGDEFLTPLNMIAAGDQASRPVRDRAQAAYFLMQGGVAPKAALDIVGLEADDIPDLIVPNLVAPPKGPIPPENMPADHEDGGVQQ